MANHEICDRCGKSGFNMLFRLEVYPDCKTTSPRTWLCAVELCHSCLNDTLKFAKGFPVENKLFEEMV
jgi:hypothetical protein